MRNITKNNYPLGEVRSMCSSSVEVLLGQSDTMSKWQKRRQQRCLTKNKYSHKYIVNKYHTHTQTPAAHTHIHTASSRCYMLEWWVIVSCFRTSGSVVSTLMARYEHARTLTKHWIKNVAFRTYATIKKAQYILRSSIKQWKLQQNKRSNNSIKNT